GLGVSNSELPHSFGSKGPKDTESSFWGMGNWTRANAEFSLLGVRGKPVRLSRAVHHVIEAPVREHSRKPDEARERIVRLMGEVQRIELFAREKSGELGGNRARN